MGCLAARTLDRARPTAFLASGMKGFARPMACLAGEMKGFALQMPCLAGQTFVPAVKTLVPAGQTLVPAVKTKGFFLQKTLFFSDFFVISDFFEENLEFWAAFHRI